MKFNGTIFSKPQQDQLKENIGKELEKALSGTEYTLDLSTESDRKTLIELSQLYTKGKTVVIYGLGDQVYYTPQYISSTYARFGTTPIIEVDGSITGVTFKSIICKPDSATNVKVTHKINGSQTQNITNMKRVRAYIKE